MLFRRWAPRPGGAEHLLKAVSRCKWPDYGLLLTVSCHAPHTPETAQHPVQSNIARADTAAASHALRGQKEKHNSVA